MRIDAIEILV